MGRGKIIWKVDWLAAALGSRSCHCWDVSDRKNEWWTSIEAICRYEWEVVIGNETADRKKRLFVENCNRVGFVSCTRQNVWKVVEIPSNGETDLVLYNVCFQPLVTELHGVMPFYLLDKLGHDGEDVIFGRSTILLNVREVDDWLDLKSVPWEARIFITFYVVIYLWIKITSKATFWAFHFSHTQHCSGFFFLYSLSKVPP